MKKITVFRSLGDDAQRGIYILLNINIRKVSNQWPSFYLKKLEKEQIKLQVGRWEEII